MIRAARKTAVAVALLAPSASAEIRDSLWRAPDSSWRALPLPGVSVRGDRRAPADPSPVTLSGRRLREALGRTLAETLAGEAGVAQRTMGPAPARPVLRGLSGHRLPVLEDGAATGDLSATAADHAVVIEPLHSRSVAVVRGPAALLHGGNAMGGAVDVQRSLVPRARPEHLTGVLSMQAESVTRGGGAALRIENALGPLVGKLEGSLRRAEDLGTPRGRLANTALFGDEGAGALAWTHARGHVGGAIARNVTDYGIPGGFLGGHARGVDIELSRTQSVVDAAWRPRAGFIERWEAVGRWTRYSHRELESSGACGVSFGMLTGDAALRAHWRGAGVWGEGRAQLTGAYRDQAQGCLSFVPRTYARSGSATLYQEWNLTRLSFHAAVRADRVAVTPARVDTNKAGIVRARDFGGLSGAVSVGAMPWRGWTLAASLMRTFQAPGVEELYSDGPHLAAYSYEVGNADLGAERGTGIEAQVRWAVEGRGATLAVFHNRFAGYLHASDTGELEVGPGEEGLLERYRYRGRDAVMTGAEWSGHWGLPAGLALEGAVAMMRGQLVSGGDLPMMPPATARLGVRGTHGAWGWTATLQGAAAQRRLDEFETPTAAWARGDVAVEWRQLGPRGLQSVVLTLENVADAEYRQHLSRVRSVSPEAGRNLKLLWRVQW